MTSLSHEIVGINPHASTAGASDTMLPQQPSATGPETQNESTSELPLPFLRGDASLPGTITYTFNNHPVRVVMKDGEQWWAAEDVLSDIGCDWNGYSSIMRVPSAFRRIIPIVTPFGAQNVAALTKLGLIFFLVMSKKPEAFSLLTWLICDAFPSSRWAGCYGIPASANLTLVAKPTLSFIAGLPFLSHNSPVVSEDAITQTDKPEHHEARLASAKLAADAKALALHINQIKSLAELIDEEFTKVMASHKLYNLPVATSENTEMVEVSQMLGVGLDGLFEALVQLKVYRTYGEGPWGGGKIINNTHLGGAKPYFHLQWNENSTNPDGTIPHGIRTVVTPMGVQWLFTLLWEGRFNSILEKIPSNPDLASMNSNDCLLLERL